MRNCEWALEMMAKPVNVEISQFNEAVNTIYSDYAPVALGGTLYYTSTDRVEVDLRRKADQKNSKKKKKKPKTGQTEEVLALRRAGLLGQRDREWRKRRLFLRVGRPWRRQATDLVPGIYEVIITGSDGCSETEEIQIMDGSMQPTVSSMAASCDDNGAAQITVGNTVGIPSFEWSNGSTGNSAAGLAPDSYTVTVTDADGCKETLDIQIPDESFDVVVQATQQR